MKTVRPLSVLILFMLALAWAAPAAASPLVAPALQVGGDFTITEIDDCVIYDGPGTLDTGLDTFTVIGAAGTGSGSKCYFALSDPSTITFVSLTDRTGGAGTCFVVDLYSGDPTNEANFIGRTIGDEGEGGPGCGATGAVDWTGSFGGVLYVTLEIFANPSLTAVLTFDQIGGGLSYFRPVRADDVMGETAAGDTTGIQTTSAAYVFAISDGLIATVIHEATGYNVQLVIGDDTVVYTNLQTTFAETGMAVTAGCVIGYAGDPPPGYPTGASYLFFTTDPDLPDWHDFADSLTNLPCNQDVGSCLNSNPNFDNNGAGWLSRYAIADHFNNAGDSVMLLPRTGELYQPFLNVDPAETYIVTVIVANGVGFNSGEITTQITGTLSSSSVTTFAGEFVTLTFAALSPSDGPNEFRITNTYDADNTLQITFACLSTSEPIIAPPTCYTPDPTLLIDGWEHDVSVTYFAPQLPFQPTGRYAVPDNSYLRYPVDISAFSDASTDFKLTITGAAGASGTPTLTANLADSDTHAEIQVIGDFTYPTVIPSPAALTFTLDAAEHIVGDLQIVNSTGGGESALVYTICLQPVGGIWPGYENPDIRHAPFQVDCTACTAPSDFTDVVGWLAWLGCLLRYLLYCLIYGLINNVWGTIVAVGNGLGLLGRWLSAAVSVVAAWFWLAAQRGFMIFISWLIPIVNTVLAWLLTLPLFVSLLDSIAIIGIWIGGIIAVILAVINLFVAGIQYVGVLLNLVGLSWLQFLDALNGASSVTFVLPDCYDSESPLYDACLVFDVLNFMIVQIPAIAVLIAAAGFAAGWKRIKQAMIKISQAIGT